LTERLEDSGKQRNHEYIWKIFLTLKILLDKLETAKITRITNISPNPLIWDE
jgi:hypothetical protein